MTPISAVPESPVARAGAALLGMIVTIGKLHSIFMTFQDMEMQGNLAKTAVLAHSGLGVQSLVPTVSCAHRYSRRSRSR